MKQGWLCAALGGALLATTALLARTQEPGDSASEATRRCCDPATLGSGLDERTRAEVEALCRTGGVTGRQAREALAATSESLHTALTNATVDEEEVRRLAREMAAIQSQWIGSCAETLLAMRRALGPERFESIWACCSAPLSSACATCSASD